MRLTKLMQSLAEAKMLYDGQDYEREIDGLYTDSRKVKKSGLYVCLTGGEKDGHAFAKEAVARGAVALMVERRLPLNVPQLLVKDSRAGLSYVAAAFYGHPAKELKIIGITGTNGKTTTAYMLASVLRRAGKNVATVGTLGVFYGKKKRSCGLTTPDPVFMQEVYADMVACGVEYVVEEVSAHALYYRKDAGIQYASCIFTNLSRDHLDFFGEMDAYRRTKLTLFDRKKCEIAIVNADDDCCEDIKRLRAGERVVTYGLENPADCFAIVTDEKLFREEFMLNLFDRLCRVRLKMTGRHNVYNALAAAACAFRLGINVGAIGGGLGEISSITGRLQRVGEYRGAQLFVDFAHTPDGLEKSLSALKSNCRGRLICLFGCGGNRDKTKRPLMGETVAKLGDFAVLTSDNPRYEDPLDIISDIEVGVRKISNRYVIVPDRERAIEYALGILCDGDVLMVAGKGGEEYQEIMGIKYPFKDQDVLRKMIEKQSVK